MSKSHSEKIIACVVRPILVAMLCCFSLITYGQRVAIKTDAVKWLMTSPNLGFEFVLSPHFSFEIDGMFNPWKIKQYELYSYTVQPELKYWFSRPLTRHYIGITSFYEYNNVKLKKNAFYGDAFAAGLTYGYDFILGRRWNLELSAGVGGMYYRQHKYSRDGKMGELNKTGWMVIPVKLGVSFVYIIR